MEHQQNYSEYTGDPGSFGYMNSFAGSEYLMPTHQGQQQMNGKSDADPSLPMVQSSLPPLASMQGFESGNSAPSQFMPQTPQMIYHHPQESTDATQFTAMPANNTQPFTSLPQDTAPDFTTTPRDFLSPPEPELDLNQQKGGLFGLDTPSLAVPIDITQVVDPVITADSQISQSDQPTATSDEPSTSTEVASGVNDSSKPLVFSPEQNSMMKALGVVRKDVLASVSGSKKRRRRILQLNEEDSDDENDLKKQMIQESPEKEAEKPEAERSSPESESDEDLSKADPKALKARYLLKTAVIIKGPEDKKKKKKKRVLESDEEDEMQTSVDDIGLMGDSNENDDAEDEYLENDIIISEPIIFDPEPEPEASTAEMSSDAACEKVDDFKVPETPAPFEGDEKKLEAKKPEDNGTPKETAAEDAGENKATSKLPAIVKTEKIVKEEPGRYDDLVNPIIKNEDGEIDPSMSVEAILDNIKPMADDDEFFKAGQKSDDSDCQFVSNEDYFGTPDLTKPVKSSSGRRSGSQSGFKRRPRQQGAKRPTKKRTNKYMGDFVEDSDSGSGDSTYSESSSDSESSDEESQRPRKPVFVKKTPPILVQSKSFTVTKVPIRKKMGNKDRFYDKSRNIPNDVYFGDVNVPLHVLHHRWASDNEDSDSGPEFVSRPAVQTSRGYNFPTSSRPTFSYMEASDDPKLSNMKEFLRIAGIKINFGKLFENVRTTDEKCMMIRRVLHQKGMPGEPTIAKCKQLRLELQAKRESAELDKSVIIREGRTRRATRTVSKPSVMPETLQTLSKIRRVVDSDSE